MPTISTVYSVYYLLKWQPKAAVCIFYFFKKQAKKNSFNKKINQVHKASVFKIVSLPYLISICNVKLIMI